MQGKNWPREGWGEGSISVKQLSIQGEHGRAGLIILGWASYHRRGQRIRGKPKLDLRLLWGLLSYFLPKQSLTGMAQTCLWITEIKWLRILYLALMAGFKQHTHAWELGIFRSSIWCRGTYPVGAVLDFPDFIGFPDWFFMSLSVPFSPLSI